ncbi:Uncharacterised protein [uncultured archaeon]|nr:Uncharacterised protein [uncultured archaeon]
MPRLPNARGQSSVETLFMLCIIMILALMIGAKFYQQQDIIITKATARQTMIAEIEKMDKKYYLLGLQAADCQTPTGERRVNYTITPDPAGDIQADAAKSKAAAEINAATGENASACYNNLNFLDCTTPC